MLLNDKKTEIDIKKTDDYNSGQRKMLPAMQCMKATKDWKGV